MNVKLFWSFDSRMNLYSDIDYIFDMYRASMISAKKLGYNVYFYGDKVAIEKLNDIIDYGFETTKIKFDIVDDLKLFIHTQHDLDCVTIDGDIILNERINFDNFNTTDVYFEVAETKKDILREENNKYNGYGDLKRMFKRYDTKLFFKHFNYDSDIACNTGIIKFNNQKSKDLIINEFQSIRNFFVNKIQPHEIKEDEETKTILRRIRFILAQYYFGCLSTEGIINTTFLKDTNNYLHMFGNEKFYDHNKELIYKILHNNQ